MVRLGTKGKSLHGKGTRVEPISVLVVGEQALGRDGMARLLSAQHVQPIRAAGTNPARLVSQRAAVRRDVVIFDASIPSLELGSLIAEVRRQNADARTLWVPGRADRGETERALGEGIHGVLDRGATLEQLVAAVAWLHRGMAYVPVQVLERAAAAGRLSPPGSWNAPSATGPDAETFATLSKREREVLWLLGNGLSVKQIGRRLFVSPRTVATHRDNIRSKLRLDTAADVLRVAVEWVVTSRSRPERAPRFAPTPANATALG